MIRRPPRSTLDRSSAASDVYKRQLLGRRGDSDRFAEDRPGADAAAESLFVERHELGAFLECLADRVEAVSYTHLRAHETVLDLVCRLLLEKKKTRPTSHVV